MASPRGRSPVTLRLAHSPDPDDAFMWWPLFVIDGHGPVVNVGRFEFEQVTSDIESLNQRAIAAATAWRGVSGATARPRSGSAVQGAPSAPSHGRLPSVAGRGTQEVDALEITAISCATYPRVKDFYALTACGASMGDAYGPKIVARSKMALDDLKNEEVVIAIPGEGTTAFAAMSMLLGPPHGESFRFRTIPFKEIIDRVAAGDFDAGLIIHEGQLTFPSSGLHQIIDLGAYWKQTRGLPLPLGVNAIRRDLDALHGEGTLREVAALLRKSVAFALAHREDSVAYALRFARDMTSKLADEFIRLYVNKWTLDFGETGREAVRVFLRETHNAGLTPDAGEVDFIG